MNTVVLLILALLMAICSVIYLKKTILYLSDERGLAILAKSAQIVFGAMFILFLLFMSYTMVLDVFDLPQAEMKLPMNFVRNCFLFMITICSLVNVIAIKYFEKKL